MKELMMSLQEMESNERNLASTLKQSSSGCNNGDEQEKQGDDTESCNHFINHAEIAWHEGRKQWIGDRTKRQNKVNKEPVISWSMTYEDLLLTNQHFHRRIPLAEMVDFLVDVWHEHGLYD
ncbi:zinc finger protein [Wolffia australiana]